jgi:hypothetical protein
MLGMPKERTVKKLLLISTVILIALAGSAYWILSHHVVLTGEGARVYPKDTLAIEDSIVNLQHCTFEDLKFHQPLVRVMLENGDWRYLPGGKEIHLAGDLGKNVFLFIQKGGTLESFQDQISSLTENAQSVSQNIVHELEITESLQKANAHADTVMSKLDKKYDINGKKEEAKKAAKDLKKKLGF